MLTKEQKEALQLLIRLYADEVARASVGEVSNPAEQAEAINLFLDEITVPEGWQVVPVEPTPAMVTAYSVAAGELTKRHLLSGSYPATWQPIEAGYTAMLAAAPKPGDSNE